MKQPRRIRCLTRKAFRSWLNLQVNRALPESPVKPKMMLTNCANQCPVAVYLHEFYNGAIRVESNFGVHIVQRRFMKRLSFNTPVWVRDFVRAVDRMSGDGEEVSISAEHAIKILDHLQMHDRKETF